MNVIENRMTQLRGEYEKGEQMLADLDRQRTELRERMLRISGAIEVLEELRNSRPEAPFVVSPDEGE